jgi:hypothetical protein
MAETQTAQDTAQDCDTMADFVLPRYVFDDTKALVESLSRDPTRAGSFHGIMDCRLAS